MQKAGKRGKLKRGYFKRKVPNVQVYKAYAMSSNTTKKEDNKKQNKKESLITEEVMEIKEIIQRTPEEQKKSPKQKNNGNPFCVFARKAVEKVVSGLNGMTKAIQKDPKRLVWITSAIGVLLFVAVIILSIRLGGVKKELESVQAMSVGLQAELDAVKAETSKTVADKKTETVAGTEFDAVLEQKTEAVLKTPGPTVTPKATATPVPTATPEPEKYVVCVDAGHGEWDGGAVLIENGVETRIEKNDNLWMAKLFRDELVSLGIEVVMTRETDKFLGLTERAVIANNVNADALISFHRNSFAGENEVSGVEFWLHNSKPEDACSLAEAMLAAVMEVGGMENRGIKYGSMSDVKENYEINRKANMASMIIELGFVTSAADNAAYDTYGEAYAAEMAKAVYEWLQVQDTKED